MWPHDSGPMDEPARPNPCQGPYRPGRRACGALLRSESLGQKARHFNRESAPILVQWFQSVKSAKACRAFLAVLVRTQDLRGSFLSTRAENCSSDTWSKREGGAVRWALNLGDLAECEAHLRQASGEWVFSLHRGGSSRSSGRPHQSRRPRARSKMRGAEPKPPAPCSKEAGSCAETPPRLDAVGG